MKTTMVFERFEQKYLLTYSQASALYESLAPYMQPDAYGKHTICSLYFDTEDFSAARAHQAKTFYREKLRLRSYGVPGGGDTVFLELKKKLDGTTFKRRMPLTLAEAKRYLRTGEPPENAGQVFGEIDWFCTQNHPEPKAVICYDRIALAGREDPSLRLTFDQNLRFREECLDLSKGDWGQSLCSENDVLLEVKSSGPFPLWLSRLLTSHQIYPASFSKYLNAAELLQPQNKEVQAYAV